jgi:hypothetical protein
MSLPAVVSELPPLMSEWDFGARTFVRLRVERNPAGTLSLEDLVRESYYKNLRGDSHAYREEAKRWRRPESCASTTTSSTWRSWGTSTS